MFSEPELPPSLGKSSVLFSAVSERWVLAVGCVLCPRRGRPTLGHRCLEGSAGFAVTPAGAGGHREGGEDAPPVGDTSCVTRSSSWFPAGALRSVWAGTDGLTVTLLPAGHGQARHVWLQDGQKWDGQAPGGAGTCPGSQLCPAPQQVRSVPVGSGLIPAALLPKAVHGGQAAPGAG